MDTQAFKVETIEYATGKDELRAVREPVFVHEQNVPLEEEWDAMDPLCRHVIARDAAGLPIGTGRLTPEHKIGRMAVLREWRGKGVGDALLLALIADARVQGWATVALNAQVSAEPFYARHGFVPQGPRFWEAGIEHQAMRRALIGPTAVDNVAAAIAVSTAVIRQGRRQLCIYSRELDPGLLDNASVLEALRRFATQVRGAQVQLLLQDPTAAQRALAPLITLAQRLPSVFALRQVTEAVDRAYPAAFIANDLGGYYYRPLGHRFEGEADLDNAGRARQLSDGFARVWERSRPCTELRALGI